MTHVEVDPQPLVIVIRREGEPEAIYEGELELSDDQQRSLKALLGDEKAKVTVSREYSDKSYGNGGSVFVSVTLTCDQSQETINAAVQWGNFLADSNAGEQLQQMKAALPRLGINQDG